MTFEEKINRIINNIETNPEYNSRNYPDIFSLYYEVEELLKIQLNTDFDDNAHPFFYNLNDQDKIQKYSEFMHDMYRYFLKIPGIDIVSKWNKEYNKEIERNKIHHGLNPVLDQNLNNIL